MLGHSSGGGGASPINTVHVDANDAGIGIGLGIDQVEQRAHARDIGPDVDRSDRLRERGDAPGSRGIGEVGRDGVCRNADVGRCRSRCDVVDVGDHDLGTGRREEARGFEADPRGPAGHDGQPTVEPPRRVHRPRYSGCRFSTTAATASC